jgi:hypothetical protein
MRDNSEWAAADIDIGCEAGGGSEPGPEHPTPVFGLVGWLVGWVSLVGEVGGWVAAPHTTITFHHITSHHTVRLSEQLIGDEANGGTAQCLALVISVLQQHMQRRGRRSGIQSAVLRCSFALDRRSLLLRL